MPPRPRKRAVREPGRKPALPPGGLLDWSASWHFDEQALPCRYCGAPTHLRDSKKSPADKVCAEAALAEIDQIIQVYSGQRQL
ncbi:hypothetical protein [Streptomyces sp. ITFR-6]|uniref:hypothetical protein n=1 Tax=Streptomyces sp. ITFR-6 TaxID=3075197 RepID=UPI00288AD515|nr:hypothetical protein [Streptomyces sp. ITFR-6]WNI31460.1 hypothetical protein RLT59_23725 [Streptomyces sp. ITFR-6]